MVTFFEMFGTRNPISSAVRTQVHDSANGKRLEVKFLFSQEVVEIAGWTPGEFLDLSCDGTRLVIEPSKGGRTLHGTPPYVELAFAKSERKQVNDFLGFDVPIKHFWEIYNVQGRRLELRLKDIDVPVLP
jgi:hypothetical protein